MTRVPHTVNGEPPSFFFVWQLGIGASLAAHHFQRGGNPVWRKCAFNAPVVPTSCSQ